VWEVVFSCQGQDQVFGSSICVTRGERNQAGEDPEEGHAMYDVCLYWIADDARGSHVRCRYDDVRWSVKEDPDEICCASEPHKRREAHQNVEELLGLVYLAPNGPRIWSFSYGRVVTISLKRPAPFD
jgi:hypothetical protein